MSYYLNRAASTVGYAITETVNFAKWSVGYGAVPATQSQQGQPQPQASVIAARVENAVIAGPVNQQMNQAPLPPQPALQQPQQQVVDTVSCCDAFLCCMYTTDSSIQLAGQAQAMGDLVAGNAGNNPADQFLTVGAALGNRDAASYVCFRDCCQQDSACCKCAECVSTVGKDILCCIPKCLGENCHLDGRCCEAIPSCLHGCGAAASGLGHCIGSFNC